VDSQDAGALIDSIVEEVHSAGVVATAQGGSHCLDGGLPVPFTDQVRLSPEIARGLAEALRAAAAAES
jgi:hypothetical protein